MSQLDAAVARVSARVLEELCFHFVDAEGESEVDVTRVTASVGFRGPWQGRVFVGVEEALLGELAGNLLADDEVGPEDRRHALLELCNVICGNLLPEIDSSQSVFELDAPRIVADGAPPPGSEGAVRFDGGKIVVTVKRDP